MDSVSDKWFAEFFWFHEIRLGFGDFRVKPCSLCCISLGLLVFGVNLDSERIAF